MFSEARVGIQATLATANLGCDIAYEGVHYERVPGRTFIAFELLQGGNSRYASIGPTRSVRALGIMQFNINIPAGGGTKPADQIADKIALLYRAPFLCTPRLCVTPLPANLRSVGTRDGYYTAILSIPYQLDLHEGDMGTVSFARAVFTGVQDSTNKVFTVTNLTSILRLQIYINGILQDPSNYSVAGQAVTLPTAPDSTDTLEFFVW